MLHEANRHIFLWLHYLIDINSTIDSIILVCAKYCDIFVIAVIALYLLFHRHYKRGTQASFRIHLKELLLVFGTSTVAWLCTLLLKYNIESPRPFLTLGIQPLFIYGGLDSFPSGHAAFFMAIAVALSYHHRRAAWCAAIAAVCIGLARIIAGIHFPFDILGGWVLGAGLAWLVYRFWLYFRARLYRQQNTPNH